MLVEVLQQQWYTELTMKISSNGYELVKKYSKTIA